MSKKNREAQDKPKEAAPAQAAGATRWSDYFWANLIFFVFLGTLAYVVRVSCDAPGDEQVPAVKVVLDETFKFLVLLFGGGFLLVTLFDAAYEFFAAKTREEEPQAHSEGPKKA